MTLVGCLGVLADEHPTERYGLCFKHNLRDVSYIARLAAIVDGAPRRHSVTFLKPAQGS